MEAIVGREDIPHTSIRDVSVTTVPFAQRMAQEYPANMLSAKFHVPYAVAALLVSGRSDVTAFYPDAVENTAIRALADRVDVVSDPSMNVQNPDNPCARVEIELADGRTVSESTTYIRGDFERRRSRQELEGKFRFLTSESLGAKGTDEVIRACANLGELADVRTLTALL